MVYFFKSLCGTYTLYMGRDQTENESLIKYGLPEDVWFHVDDLSSAHVYLRMTPGMAISDLPEATVVECAALVKANSIAGCKKASVHVVYTRWKNLKKTRAMVDGQVGFHRPDNVKRLEVEKNNALVRQLEKSKTQAFPDLYRLQQDRTAELQREAKLQHKLQQEQEQKELQATHKEKEARSYDRIMTQDQMTSNADIRATVDASAAEEYEDDFF